MYKVVDFFLDQVAGVGGAQFATFTNDCEEPVVSEQFVLAVGCFGDAVGVKEQRVARLEVVSLLLVNRIFHGGHDYARLARNKFGRAVFVSYHGRVVASRGKVDMARAQVDNACPHGYEHVQAVALGKSVVGLAERIADRLQVLGHGA